MWESNGSEFEDHDDSDFEIGIEAIDEIEKSIIYGLFGQISSLQNFYSKVQSGYKKISLTWLIAGLIGIGYVFSQEIRGLPFNPIFIAIFISIAGICGVTLLWFLDIIIYQTYFFSSVVELIKLERANQWLPRININTGFLQFNKKTNLLQSPFYVYCNLVFLFLIFLMSIALVNFDKIYIAVFSVFFVFLGWLIHFCMIRAERPKKTSPMRDDFKRIIP